MAKNHCFNCFSNVKIRDVYFNVFESQTGINTHRGLEFDNLNCALSK